MSTDKFVFIMVICLVVVIGLIIIHIKATIEAQRELKLKFPKLPLWEIRFETDDHKVPAEYSTQIVGYTKEIAIKKLIDNTNYANQKDFKILSVELVKE